MILQQRLRLGLDWQIERNLISTARFEGQKKVDLECRRKRLESRLKEELQLVVIQSSMNCLHNTDLIRGCWLFRPRTIWRYAQGFGYSQDMPLQR